MNGITITEQEARELVGLATMALQAAAERAGLGKIQQQLAALEKSREAEKQPAEGDAA